MRMKTGQLMEGAHLKLCVPGTRAFRLFTNGAAKKPGSAESSRRFFFADKPVHKTRVEACAELGKRESFLHRSGAAPAETGPQLRLKHLGNAALFCANWN